MTSTSTTTAAAAQDPLRQLVHEKNFLTKQEADELYVRLDAELPWGTYSWVPGTPPLKQLVYYYDVEEQHERPNALLQQLVTRIEQQYNTKAVVTWCNKFRDCHDAIDWHQDQYDMSLFVLSFGAGRPIEIRPRKNPWLHKADRPATQTLNVQHGDLYHWTAEFDQTMEHRVPAVADATSQDGPRISILVLGHPINSNNDPAKLQNKIMAPVYTGQCTKCQGFLQQAKSTMWGPERKCKGCGKKYYFSSWE